MLPILILIVLALIAIIVGAVPIAVVLAALIGTACASISSPSSTMATTGGARSAEGSAKPAKSANPTDSNTNFIVLPTQLFEDIELASSYDTIYVVEDPVYFTRLPFHQLKLVFHRTTLKYYNDYLVENTKSKVIYVEFPNVDKLYDTLPNATLYDPVDKITKAKLDKIPNIHYIETPYFLTPMSELAEYKKTIKSYRHDSSFYRWQRRRLNVLMNRDKPKNDQWTYDEDNRNPFPDEQKEPTDFEIKSNKYIEEAKEYVKKHFSKNYGDPANMVYPVTHKDAKQHLKKFIEDRFKLFGKYQDGAHTDITFGYHSVMSSSINVGLITPREVLDEVLDAKNIPMASKEGFIRQLIGWREYCRLIYEFEGEKMRKLNYFNAKRKLTPSWWEGTTGLSPIDTIIKRVNKYSYAHHIERLMYLSSVMLMCGIDPNEVYEWFIGFVSIDAYDWVMVPNIYGMGSYADGGIMMTRPYFSSSAYVEKMSNLIEKDSDADIFDCLYYNFIAKNKERLRKNYYTARSIGHYDRKTAKEKEHFKEIADAFIKKNTL